MTHGASGQRPVLWSLRLLKLMMNPARAFTLIAGALRSTWGLEQRFESLRDPKAAGGVTLGPSDFETLNRTLAASGHEVEIRRIDVPAVMDFYERGRYGRRWLYYAGGRDRMVLQKVAEHCVAAELLGLNPSDVYLDVASQGSPAPDIYREMYGCRVLRQDLAYMRGVHRERIGGSAASIPLPDASVSKIALHNAFEHFEGNADTGFILEAARLLRPGGRLCILPLFIHPIYSVQTDLAILAPEVANGFDFGARIHHAPGWRDRHGRFYDVPQLIRRVIQPSGELHVRIIHYENATELFQACHLHYAAVFERVATVAPIAESAETVAEAITLQA